MATIDLDKINSKVDKFVDERDWGQFHSIKNLSMALSVEASELLEIFQWLSEDQSDEVGSDDRLREKVEAEIADVFIYLARIAKKADIDLEKAVFAKIRKNAEKYPVSLSKGNAKKYDEL